MTARSTFTNGDRLWALDRAIVLLAREAKMRMPLPFYEMTTSIPPAELERAAEILMDMTVRSWREVPR